MITEKPSQRYALPEPTIDLPACLQGVELDVRPAGGTVCLRTDLVDAVLAGTLGIVCGTLAAIVIF